MKFGRIPVKFRTQSHVQGHFSLFTAWAPGPTSTRKLYPSSQASRGRKRCAIPIHNEEVTAILAEEKCKPKQGKMQSAPAWSIDRPNGRSIDPSHFCPVLYGRSIDQMVDRSTPYFSADILHFFSLFFSNLIPTWYISQCWCNKQGWTFLDSFRR